MTVATDTDPSTGGVGTVETRTDFGTDDADVVAFWIMQDKIAEKEERTWLKRARKIVERYRDERPENQAGEQKFNILWSNVETLKPALYGRMPKAMADRRYKNQADVTGRLAATIIEACLEYSLETGGYDDAMRSVVEDRLLPGRGILRVLYEPTFGDEIEASPGAAEDVAEAGDTPSETSGPLATPEQSDADEAQPDREVTDEAVRTAYVYWEDYREGPARQWSEVPWLRYRAFLTRDELVKRFGAAKGKKINLDVAPKSGDSDKEKPVPDAFKKAEIWEIWDRVEKCVIWVAPGTPDILPDKQDDPLGLHEFFPSPDPLFATTTNNKRIPVPDYVEYQDQAREMDELTARIGTLEKALKVVGVYPGSEKATFTKLFQDGNDNQMIPVEDWVSFSGDKGGIEGQVMWVPIQQVAEVVIQLYAARDKAKQVIYEITGIADIIRGATAPEETATAQQLKSQYATLRLSESQKAVTRFCRDTIRLMAGVIALHFDPKTISKMSGYPQLVPVPQLPPRPMPPPPQLAPTPAMGGNVVPMPGAPPQPPQPDPAQMQFQQAMQQWQQQAQAVQAATMQNQQLQAQFDAAIALMKSDALRDFRIDIEADSTVVPDEQADQQARTQFLSEVVPFLQQVIPVAMGNPALAELGKELSLFAVRGFKVARSLEDAFEKAFDSLAKQPPPPQPGNENQASDQAKAQAITQDSQTDAQSAQVANQAAMAKVGVDQQMAQATIAINAKKAQDDAAYKAGRLQLEARKQESQDRFRAVEIENMQERAAEGLN